jgi:hypothetical protein
MGSFDAAMNKIIPQYVIPSPNNRKLLHPGTEFLYPHQFFFGGVTTFTAHLFYTIGSMAVNNSKIVLRPTSSNKSEKRLRNFGYGLQYRNISADSLRNIKYPFVTMIKDDYFHILSKLNNRNKNDGQTGEIDNNTVVVIHDPRDISNRIFEMIKKWKNIITIRRTVQEYLKQRFGLDSLFLYHPFYPYPTISKNPKRGAVCISRIGFGKNIDVIIKANKLLASSGHHIIKLYGCPTPMYVYFHLGGQKGDFKNNYYGKFDRSFSSLSNIISQSKFVVDLSLVKYDGGGTQYTFLEAIHNDCALILHRNWIEDLNPKYCDFKQGYNCFAVDNEKELAELIRSNPDITKITQNAKKLMRRHTNIDWSQIIDNN